MNFDYFGNLEDWADENGYDAYDILDEKVILRKHDPVVEFFLHKKSENTYARLTAYSSYDNGYYDITLDCEWLKKVEKQVVVTTHEYV